MLSLTRKTGSDKMASDVKVSIKIKEGTGSVSFGYPLILAVKSETVLPYTECASIDEVMAALMSVTGGADAKARTADAKATSIYQAADLLFLQEDIPDKIAVMAVSDDADDVLDGSLWAKEWRQLLIADMRSMGKDDIKAVADIFEAKDNKIFFAHCKNIDDFAAVKDYERTVAFYYNDENDREVTEVVCPPAALVGATAGKAVGSFTYKNIILKGLKTLTLTDTQIENIHKGGAVTFVTKAGDKVTSEGIVLNGEYIDIIDSKDWIIRQIEYKTQKALNSSDKIPYDNNGIAMLENICVDVLNTAYNSGIIAVTDAGTADYSVNYAGRLDTSLEDRTARKYIMGEFKFALAGAIHNVEISGTVEI